VKAVPVDSALRLDLDAMIAAAQARAWYSCATQQPTSTVHTLADIERTVRTIKQRSPETAILIDEAYIDYCTAPGREHRRKLALELPGVFHGPHVSKAYGMAGMRMATRLAPGNGEQGGTRLGLGSINELQPSPAIAALNDTATGLGTRREQAHSRLDVEPVQGDRLRRARFADQLLFRHIRRPAAGFRDACRARAWPSPDFRDGKDARAHLARHHGRHAEGHGPCSSRR